MYQAKGFTPKKYATHPGKGPEYHGECPSCGGKDRFILWSEKSGSGEFWCRQCEIGGNLITWLMKIEKYSYREACNATGKEYVVKKYSPRAPASVSPRTNWSPRSPVPPADAWREKASAFVAWCCAQLKKRTDVLAYLESRGIDSHTAENFNLGFNPREFYRHRPAWGLPEEIKADGRHKPIWLPSGLVIPGYDPAGRLCRVRIRRADSVTKNRYIAVSGSVSFTFAANKQAKAAVIVESELDAIMLHQAIGDKVCAVGLGSASTRPDEATNYFLGGVLKILVALDADEAGQANSGWYVEKYRNASLLKISDGCKDPGDMFKKGENLRAWVENELPPVFHIFKIA